MENILQPKVSRSLWKNIHQVVKKMEWIENTTKYKQKPIGFRLWVVVSVLVYVGVCVYVFA